MEFVLSAVAWRPSTATAGCFLIAQAGLFICCTKTVRLFWGIMILLKFHVPSRDFFLQSFANFDCLWNTIYTLRTEPSSIFLAKSGRGRNLCRHPRKFILNMLQIRIFLRRQSNRYRSIHCVCQLFVSKCKCWRERTSSFSTVAHKGHLDIFHFHLIISDLTYPRSKLINSNKNLYLSIST